MKKYFSEILLITNHNNQYTLFDWLYWHLNIIKVDHIILIDNNSSIDVKKICNLFNDKITYIKYENNISQSEIYTEYVNKSESCWVLPIDDDEFLYVSDKYENNINNLLYDYTQKFNNVFKFSVNWVSMYSKNLYKTVEEKQDYLNLYDYTYDINFVNNNKNNNNIEIFNYIKSIVNTTVKHFYPKDSAEKIRVDSKTIAPDNKNFAYNFDQLGSVHNPITILNNTYLHSYNTQDNDFNVGFFHKNSINYDGDMLLFHYKYRSLDEWLYKIHRRNRFNDLYSTYNDNYYDDIINIIYSHNNEFTKCDIAKNLYNKYKNKIITIKNDYL